MLPFFYFFAVSALAGAGLVLFSRNVMRAAFALMASLLSVAALYVLASADFVAVTQLMVYVGGVLVLIIFGIMFTSDLSGKPVQTGHHHVRMGALIGVSGLGGLLYLVLSTDFAHLPWIAAVPKTVAGATVAPIGHALMTHYVLPFEVVGVLLLLALVGAAFIAGRKVG
jgi:NADH-quinone oxidoreductase subunit J